MTPPPVVSVIVPFLNAQRFLGETIQSVLAQTFTDWELILVDDGSSDASSAIARDFATRERRIGLLEHPDHENRGLSASRNFGFSHAQGEFVATLDSDDVWEPRKLEEQLAILRAHPTAAAVFGAPLYWQSWCAGATRTDFIPHLAVEMDALHHPCELALRSYPLGTGSAPCPSDMLIKRQALQTVGGWDDRFRLYEDQFVLMKLYLHFDIYVSSHHWTRYRIHSDQICATTSRRAYWDERLTFLEWLDAYLRTETTEDATLRKKVTHALRFARQPAPIRRLLRIQKAIWRRTAGRLVPSRSDRLF